MGKLNPFTGQGGLQVFMAQFGDTATLDIVDTPDIKDDAVSTEKLFLLTGPLAITGLLPATTNIFSESFTKAEATSTLKLEFGCTSTTGTFIPLQARPSLQFFQDASFIRSFNVLTDLTAVGDSWTWFITGLAATSFTFGMSGATGLGLSFSVKDCYLIITEMKK